MSSRYTKVFKKSAHRQILTKIVFELFPNTELGFSAITDDDNANQIIDFMDEHAEHIKDAFGLEIMFGDAYSAGIVTVANPLPLPVVHSKKKRSQNHAKLVAMSRVNRDIQRSKKPAKQVDAPSLFFDFEVGNMIH